MPHIVEFQCLHWGSLPAHPVPLMPERVTALVGSNGANKTTFLDGIKLLFGLTRFPGGAAREERTAEGYIYRPGDEADAEPAEYALVKGVFANLPRASGERPFAGATLEGPDVDRMTVVAHVRPGQVRWLLLDGHRTWGADGRDFKADIESMLAVRSERWLKRPAYRRVMQDAGVSSALLQVLGLGQGQASAALEGDEREVLRHVVQMLGQQRALDGFIAAVNEHRGVRAELQHEQEQLEQAQTEVERLGHLAELHGRWVKVSESIGALRRELPFSLLVDQRRRQATLAEATAGLEGLERELPELVQQQRNAISEQQNRRHRRGPLAEERQRATAEATLAEQAEQQARAALEARPQATPACTEAVRQRHKHAVGSRARLENALDDHRRELQALEAGALRRPETVGQLLDQLGYGTVLAEHLEVDDREAADLEARLGEAIWAVGVPSAKWAAAVEAAGEVGADCPVVRLTPDDEPFRKFLDEVTRFPPQVAVDDGVLRGGSFVWRRAHSPRRLGEAGRLKRRDALRELISTEEAELAGLTLDVEQLAQELVALEAATTARKRLPELESLRLAAAARVTSLGEEEDTIVRRLESLAASLATVRSRLNEIQFERKEHQDRAAAERRALKELQEELATHGRLPPSPPDVRPLQVVRSELQARNSTLAAFSDAVKDETLPGQLQRQEERVKEITELVSGSVRRVDALHEQVEDARRRFNAGVRQTVPRLDAEFRRLCEQTGMTGRIDLVELDDDEFGLDVKIRATHGSHTLGLRSAHLSGGQQAKAALIVLLACMSLEGGTDFLLSDEPGAHLDARNLREVGLAMQHLSDRVQIIISVPTDAEAERLDWAGHQIGFAAPDARNPDYPFSSLVVMSRTPAAPESVPERAFDES